MLRKLRIAAAVVCFTLVTLLFLDFTGTLHAWFGWLARIQFLPALLAVNVGVVAALVVATLLFGRVYCSVVCPLGVMQDGISHLAGRRTKNRFRYSPAKTALRYTVLALFIAALAAGIGSLVALLAPTAPTAASRRTCWLRSGDGATTCWPTSPNASTATPSIAPTSGCAVRRPSP